MSFDRCTRELFLECVHPEDRERVDWAIMRSLSGVNEGFYDIEYRIVDPGKSTRVARAMRVTIQQHRNNTIYICFAKCILPKKSCFFDGLCFVFCIDATPPDLTRTVHQAPYFLLAA
jgi:hypothetical protein